MALPPSLAGAVKSMTARASYGVALTMVGAPGTVRGVTAALPEGAPAPAGLVAVTLHE